MAGNKLATMSIIATTQDRLKDLVIKDGQLIFVHDTGRVVLDIKGKRTFYNQITEIATEDERKSYENPVNGQYYFVLDTAVLWHYRDRWIQISGTASAPTVFIGDVIPEVGSANTVYIDKKVHSVSVWDDETNSYIVVADKTDINSVEDNDIESLFV